MIAQEYKKMLGAKSVIREMFTYGTERAKEIGKENVFDYSLGNPSVPVPEKFTKKMIELLETESPVALHGYSPSLGIDSVREAVAVSLEKRFGLPYKNCPGRFHPYFRTVFPGIQPVCQSDRSKTESCSAGSERIPD